MINKYDIEFQKKNLEKVIQQCQKTLDKIDEELVKLEPKLTLYDIEVGASWEVCAFVSHIYLPSSSGSPYPDIFSIKVFDGDIIEIRGNIENNIILQFCSVVV